MTPQEQQLIAGLIDRVSKTQLTEKDPEAEQMLQQGLGRTPDALYILAQTVLVQQFALEQAKHQLADAQAQSQAHAQEPKHATSFLGSLFGHSDPAPPPPPQQASYQPVPNYAQAPPPSQAAYAQQPSFQTTGAPAGGGFLRSALQTATGVAAGALAFQGVESLLHGFGGGGFGGGQGLGGFGSGGGRPEEVVNNYYGDSNPDRNDSGLSSDIEDRRGDNDNSQFADTDDNTGDDNTGDDTSTDDSGDLGSFDDGGGSDSFDSGGGDDSSFS